MRAVAWCMISTLIGAVIFGAGMVFERLLTSDIRELEAETGAGDKQEKLPGKDDIRFLGQWKNLLDYDGTRQEETEYEDM